MLGNLMNSKTKIMAIIMVLLGGLDVAANMFLGFHFLPDLGVQMTGTELILAGLTALFMRLGIDKAGAA